MMALFVFLTALLALFSGTSLGRILPIRHGAPLRILPLGDSITFGYGEPSGNSYRRYLECLLHTAGNPVQLIGAIQHGDWPNNHNDGFNLHTIDQILEAGTPELTRSHNAQPNILLLHAGTVNFVVNTNVTNAPSRLENLVDFIITHNPSTLVVVAKLVPNANETIQSRIDDYNEKIPEIVASRFHQGKKITLVDLTHLNTDHDLLADGTHLNGKGASKVAKDWLCALHRADRRGLITPAYGPLEDLGESSVPESGLCEDII